MLNWRDAWNQLCALFSTTLPNEANRIVSIINYINAL